jgi:hypothetical protein
MERCAVIVAMTGSEWPLTGELAQAYILPRLARFGIRLIQVARSGHLKEDGYTVLDDSRAPSELHMRGDFTLFMEMVRAGTIPQLGGARKCSQKAKGYPLDWMIAKVTNGAPFYQIMGFEANEASRCLKDAKASKNPMRAGVYPLTTWDMPAAPGRQGWTREVCEQFIFDALGIWWPKSACTFCVYALVTKAGQARVLEGFARAPELAYEPLVMEQIAVALNPTQTLLANQALYDLMAATPGQERALAMFEQRLDHMQWALVQTRRAMDAKDGDANLRGATARALTIHGTGSRSAMKARLFTAGALLGHADVDRRQARYPRVWLNERMATYPTTDHLLTIVPALVADKIAPAFPNLWPRVRAAELRRPALPVQDGLFGAAS